MALGFVMLGVFMGSVMGSVMGSGPIGWAMARGRVPRRAVASIRVMIRIGVDSNGDFPGVAFSVARDGDDLLRSIIVDILTVIAVQYWFHLFSPRYIWLARLREVGDEVV